MSSNVPTPQPGRSITRRDLEAIIRRAAELSLAEADTSDNLSEEELLRIASELGLPAQHVRQALYEQPVLGGGDTWYDRWFGPAALAQSRAVPGRPETLQARLEEYLATHEYLQVVRRRPSEMVLIPAEDAISRVARVFARPTKRFGLAHAERVVIALHSLPDQKTHLRVETDFTAERSRSVSGGVWGGGLLGAAVGAGLATVAALTTSGAVEAVLIGGNLAVSTGAGVALAVKLQAGRFRERMHRVKVEIAHLLDRAETGQSLEPPPAPWRRNLHAKLFGPRR